MIKCIICKTEKPSEYFTEEHIFPESIGGTLTLNSVCKECNDFLGHSVDSHLVNHFIVELARSNLKISGKTNKIPNPLEQGTLTDDPLQQVKYRCDQDGEPIGLYIVTKFQGDIIKDGGIKITVDKTDRDKLPSMIDKMLKRRKLSKEKIAQRSKEISSSPYVSVKLQVDTIKYKRAILKIAYELAYYWLGDAYLSDSTGEMLRCCIRDKSLQGDWAVKYPTIKANIKFLGENPESPLWEMWDNEPHSHVAILRPIHDGIVCGVRIFNIFEGIVLVSEDLLSYPDFSKGDSPGNFIAINSQTGEKRESNFYEEIERIEKQIG